MGSTLDRYTHGHHESVIAQHRKRTAAEAAGFLLPHLRAIREVFVDSLSPERIAAVGDAMAALRTARGIYRR